MHGPAGGTGGAGDGRPTEPLSLRELFDLNAYWLAINILWGALGISLLPVLMVDVVCHGESGLPQPDRDPARPDRRQGHRRGDHRQPRRDHRDPRPAHRRGDQRPHHQPSRAAQAVHSRRHAVRHGVPARVLPRRRVDRPPRLLLPAPVQLELRAGPVPGLHARPRPGQAGRAGERADGADDPARRWWRGDAGRGRVGARQRPLRRVPDHGRRAGDDAPHRDPRPRRAPGHPARGQVVARGRAERLGHGHPPRAELRLAARLAPVLPDDRLDAHRDGVLLHAGLVQPGPPAGARPGLRRWRPDHRLRRAGDGPLGSAVRAGSAGSGRSTARP